MTDKELIALVASLAVENKKTEALIKETSEQMKKTDEKLERMGISLANIGRNNGAVAEDFFYSSLEKNKKLGNIQYDEIGQHWQKDFKNTRGAFASLSMSKKAEEEVLKNGYFALKQQGDHMTIKSPIAV